MKYRVHYAQIRLSERRAIYRNAVEMRAESKDAAAKAIAGDFLHGDQSEIIWAVIDVEEME